MTTKATNDGTCQICNRRQRVPGGVIAKHGYTVDHGYFNGVCSGSEHLPYELSRDLLPAHITRLTNIVADITKSIEKHMVPATEPKAKFHAYVKDSRGRYEYRWVTATLTLVEGHVFINFRNTDTNTDEVKPGLRNSLYARDEAGLLDIATKLNARYADALRGDLRFFSDMLAATQRRYDSWTLKPLLPLTEAGKTPETPERKQRADERQAKRDAKTIKAGALAERRMAKYEKLVPIEIRAKLDGMTEDEFWRSETMRALHIDLPYEISNLLEDEWKRANSKRTYNEDPREIIARAEAAKARQQ